MRKVYGQTLLDEMIARQGLPTPLVKQAAQEILEVIREGLIRDGVVNVSHFGTFRLKAVAERQGVNPQTREPIVIPAHQRVTFSPSKALRELIQPIHEPPKPLDEAPAEATQAAPLTPPSPLKNTDAKPENGDSPAPQQQPEAEPQVTLTASDSTLEQEAVKQTDSPLAANIEQTQQRVSSNAVSPLPEEQDDTSQTQEKEKAVVIELEPPRSKPERSNGRRYALGGAAIVVLLLLSSPLLFRDETGTQVKEVNPIAPTSPIATTQPVTPAEPMPTTTAALLPNSGTGPVVETTPREPLEENPVTTEPVSMEKAVVVERSGATLPQTTPEPPLKNKQAEAGTEMLYFTERHYRVESGESLWRLARRYYHDPLLWPHIYQANAEKITNPDHIPQGNRIVLPSLEGTPEKLSQSDRHNIAKGYYLTYLYYKKAGRKEAFFALLEAKRYDSRVVEENRSRLQLSRTEEFLLSRQRSMPQRHIQ
jgi:DNA-binding protein HU-beta